MNSVHTAGSTHLCGRASKPRGAVALAICGALGTPVALAGEAPGLGGAQEPPDGIALAGAATQALVGFHGLLMADESAAVGVAREVSIFEFSPPGAPGADLRVLAASVATPFVVGTFTPEEFLSLPSNVSSDFAGSTVIIESRTARLAWGHYVDLFGVSFTTLWMEIESTVDWTDGHQDGAVVQSAILPLGVGDRADVVLAFHVRAIALGLETPPSLDGPGDPIFGGNSGADGTVSPPPIVPVVTCMSWGWTGKTLSDGSVVQCCAMYINLLAATGACDTAYRNAVYACLGKGALSAGTCLAACLKLAVGTLVIPGFGQLTTSGCLVICGVAGLGELLTCVAIADNTWDGCMNAACTTYAASLITNACWPLPAGKPALAGPCGSLLSGGGTGQSGGQGTTAPADGGKRSAAPQTGATSK